MAEILSKQYQSAFSTSRDNKVNFPLRVTENFLTDFKISESAMESAMKDIKSSSAPGPDDLPAYLYNTYAKVLAPALVKIWRRSLDTGISQRAP